MTTNLNAAKVNEAVSAIVAADGNVALAKAHNPKFKADLNRMCGDPITPEPTDAEWQEAAELVSAHGFDAAADISYARKMGE